MMPAVFLQLGPMLRSLLRHKSAFALVVLEMASGFTILACLLAVSSWYVSMARVPSGHEEADLVQVVVQQPAAAEGGAQALAAAAARQRERLSRLRALPGVRAAVPVSASMIDPSWAFPTLFTAGPARAAGRRPEVLGHVVHTEPQVVEVLGLRFVEGGPPASDVVAAGGVIVTRCLREGLFPGGAPALGAALRGDDGTALPVLAVVEDVYMRNPLVQHANCVAFRFATRLDERREQYLVRAGSGQRQQVLGEVTRLLGAAGPDRHLTVAPFDSAVGLHAGLVRALVVILGIIAGVVAMLALLGALAVSSFLVAERTRQIGVRRALGARRGDVVAYFLVENTIASLLGTMLGLGFTVALYQLMREVFVGIQLRPAHLGFTAGLLWLDGMLAALLPARRAAEIPPSVASRAA